MSEDIIRLEDVEGVDIEIIDPIANFEEYQDVTNSPKEEIQKIFKNFVDSVPTEPSEPIDISNDLNQCSVFFNIFNDEDDSEKSNSEKNEFSSDVYSLKVKLEMILKDKFQTYERTLQDWFNDQIEFDEYEKQIRECLNEEQLHVHNQYILNIIKNSFDSEEQSILLDNFNSLIDKLFDEDENEVQNSPQADNYQTEELVNFQDDIKNCDDDDDEDILMIKKKKRKKRKRRFQILDDEDGEAQSDTENVIHSLSDDDIDKGNTGRILSNKRKRRKAMLITSDDEDGLTSVFDTESSNSNVLSDTNDTKTIDVKSTGLLKTTITINSSSSRNEKSFPLLDQLLSSQTPISLLDTHSNSNLTKTSGSTFSTNDLGVSNHINAAKSSTSKLTSVNKASQLVGSNLSSGKKIILKSTLLKQCLTSSLIQVNSNKSSTKSISSLLASDNANSNVINTSNNHYDNGSTVNNRLNNSNSQIVELLNRQPSKSADTFNCFQSSFSPTSQKAKLSTALESLLNSDDTCERLLNNNETHLHDTSTFQLDIDANNHMSDYTDQDNTYQYIDSIKNEFEDDDYYNKNGVTQSFEKYDPVFNGFIDKPLTNGEITEECDDKELIQNDEDVSDKILIRPMSPQERINNLKTCFQEVSLPDSIRLGLRVSEISSRQGLLSVDKRVTNICNIALKNFMRNILTELITSRSAFLLRHNRFRYNIGKPPINPYLHNSFRAIQKELYPDLDASTISLSSYIKSNSMDDNVMLRNVDTLINSNAYGISCSNSHSSSLDSKLRQKKIGLNKNELLFGADDQVLYSIAEKQADIRSISGPLYVPDHTELTDEACNLRHLFNLLNTDRSIIPVHSVWSRALYRTIAAFNNVTDR